MCGLAGFWQAGGLTPDAPTCLRRMMDALRHRGPDHAADWLDPAAGIALGHRRLAILDLSSEGHQPMHSASGRYVVVYNGEIYNWRSLRAAEELRGVPFRGHSDTEVLLAVIERRGLEAAVNALVGMFAFALWDRAERSLALVRDRFGEKPLYYGWSGGTFLFGSELRALSAHPAGDFPVDRGSLALLLGFGCVPAPWSIRSGVFKLEPGTILRLRDGTPERRQRYWCPVEVARGVQAAGFAGSPQDAVQEVRAQLATTVSDEMVADVALGAFLSGGVDSSTVVAAMTTVAGGSRVRTFTIGFPEQGFNEAEEAREVAARLGTAHTELVVSGAEACEVVPRLGTIYDEPFADASQIPTYLVAALTRRFVTVALSGDGGDELFGGYNRYALMRHHWRTLARLPRAARRLLARIGLAVPPGMWSRALGVLRGARRPGPGRWQNPTDRALKLLRVLDADSPETLYRRLLGAWEEPARVVLGLADTPAPPALEGGQPAGTDLVRAMMLLDAELYLPDDILVKVDRATMAVSLESRAPFLDHRMAELAWRIPTEIHFHDGRGKWVLRQLLAEVLPAGLVNRPKKGFEVPLADWLRGPLAGWADDLLSADRLRRQGFLDADQVTTRWKAHRSGTRNEQVALWPVLAFQAWLDGGAAPAGAPC
ncbi:MAG TPA: asparagine synthase (glutamine-hydrolyzing) [Gemmatimonadales bacterium]|nr:asparagine synthase (glutamine-hydrolyzing) [Gemmatimonadales bacterium]